VLIHSIDRHQYCDVNDSCTLPCKALPLPLGAHEIIHGHSSFMVTMKLGLPV